MLSARNVGRTILLLLSGAVCQQAQAVLQCGGPTIDVRKQSYPTLPAVYRQDVGAYSEYELRTNVMVAVSAHFRTLNPTIPLNAGKSFKIIYKDGSRECGVVLSPSSTVGAIPIEGTQSDGMTFEVESSRWFIRQFAQTSFHSTYQICYDYYSNGEWTATQCTVKVW